MGTGDFNNDGKTDLVWQHKTTGGVYVWLMDEVTLSSDAWVLYSSDLNWGLVGTGSCNNDGKTDFLWEHKTTGGVYVWLMDGVVLSSGAWILNSADLNWKLVAPDSEGEIDPTVGETYIRTLVGFHVFGRRKPETDISFMVFVGSKYQILGM